MITKEAVCDLIWHRLWMIYHYKDDFKDSKPPTKKDLVIEIETLINILEQGDIPLLLYDALQESCLDEFFAGNPLEGKTTY